MGRRAEAGGCQGKWSNTGRAGSARRNTWFACCAASRIASAASTAGAVSAASSSARQSPSAKCASAHAASAGCYATCWCTSACTITCTSACASATSASSVGLGSIRRCSVAVIACACHGLLHCWGVLLGHIGSSGRAAIVCCVAGEYSSATLAASAGLQLFVALLGSTLGSRVLWGVLCVLRRAMTTRGHSQTLMDLGGVGWFLPALRPLREAMQKMLRSTPRQAREVHLLSPASASASFAQSCGFNSRCVAGRRGA